MAALSLRSRYCVVHVLECVEACSLAQGREENGVGMGVGGGGGGTLWYFIPERGSCTIRLSARGLRNRTRVVGRDGGFGWLRGRSL